MASRNVRAISVRSQLDALRGRTVIVIGGAVPSKRSVWQSAKRHGLSVVLVEEHAPTREVLAGLIPRAVIEVPGLNRNHGIGVDKSHCARIVSELRRLGLRPDGVLTFWEDCTVIAALLANTLGLRGNPIAAQQIAKNKLSTYQSLSQPHSGRVADGESDLRPILPHYVTLRGRENLLASQLHQFSYPSVLRYAYGSSAVGTRFVASISEAENALQDLFRLLRKPGTANAHYPGCGFSFWTPGDSVMLAEYVQGTEHDVDLLLYDGQLVDAWVTDNGPVELPQCAETCSLMPSALPAHLQHQLIVAAYQVCRRIGLTDGACNVEFILSARGPKLLEINGRMGGAYIPEFTNQVWGLDLPAACFLIACGIRPLGRVRREPRLYIASVMCFPGDGAELGDLIPASYRVVNITTHVAEHADHLYPEPVMTVGFVGRSAAAAVDSAQRQLGRLFPGRSEIAAAHRKRIRALGQSLVPVDEIRPGE